MKYTPTYQSYCQLLNAAKSTGKISSFEEARSAEKFIIIRHDIEFSIEKALIMAEIEKDLGVSSTYFVQIGSEAYNAFSKDSLTMLNKISYLGHDIGLHYRQETKDLYDTRIIEKQLDCLQTMMPFAKRLVACHMPKKGTPYHKYFGNFINAYSEPFFYLTNIPATAPTRYIADSRWEWNYGEPDYKTFEECDRIQLLVHPFRWSAKGDGVERTFERIKKTSDRKREVTFMAEDGVYQGAIDE